MVFGEDRVGAHFVFGVPLNLGPGVDGGAEGVDMGLHNCFDVG